jgi:hypothetical protein
MLLALASLALMLLLTQLVEKGTLLAMGVDVYMLYLDTHKHRYITTLLLVLVRNQILTYFPFVGT